MTTLVEPGTYRNWRVARVQVALAEIGKACAPASLTRGRAEALANELREIALTVADLYVCPICGHPEVRTCTECPTGGDTARVAPDLPHP